MSQAIELGEARSALKTGESVISMGGFSGSDEAMTVERLQELVASGELRYIVLGGGRGGEGAGNDEITSWVQAEGKAVELGDGTTSLYELG